MRYFLVILGTLLLIGGFSLVVYKLFTYVKKHQKDADEAFKNMMYYLLGLAATVAIGAVMINFGVLAFDSVNMEAKFQALTAIGGLLFFFTFIMFIGLFVIYYYKTDLDPKYKKKLKIFYPISVILTFVFLLAWFEGGSNYFSYPLISGFEIGENGFRWTTFNNHTGSAFKINFYAFFILGGAVFVYLLCDHKLFQKYGEHGMLESTFFVAFPAGIIGARIWYVVGQWSTEFAPYFATDPWKMFRMWDGGLTIIGGAVGGIVVGVLWVILTHKRFDVLDAIDIIVPTILLAQAIGRWGNFFNHEVYGYMTFDIESCWYLPSFIKYQMATTFPSSGVPTGEAYMPLFLIEGLLNVAGYFLITSIPKGVNQLYVKIKNNKLIKNGASEEQLVAKNYKFVVPGCAGGLYLIFYGTIRAILEPLRDPKYNMGSNGLWSVINSLIMIGLGVLVIVFMYVYAYKIKPTILLKKSLKASNSDIVENAKDDSTVTTRTEGKKKKKDSLND